MKTRTVDEVANTLLEIFGNTTPMIEDIDNDMFRAQLYGDGINVVAVIRSKCGECTICSELHVLHARRKLMYKGVKINLLTLYLNGTEKNVQNHSEKCKNQL